MNNDSKKLDNVVEINEGRIADHLDKLVRGTVEETLNAILDAEVDALCRAQRYDGAESGVVVRHYLSGGRPTRGLLSVVYGRRHLQPQDRRLGSARGGVSWHTSELVHKACLAEGIHEAGLVLHADNVAPMLATLQRLGVIPSFSQPSVSDDNPYSESLFRPMNYLPGLSE